jgi:peptidoglycan/xylan/chitin deacetylase (PgdA/CDA1 family)
MRGQRIKLPALMYHEVSSNSSKEPLAHLMTPFYDITVDMFEHQVSTLCGRGYRSMLACQDDLVHLDPDHKNLLITFDDGWMGNYDYAFPVLKAYGFTATFFVAVNYIGSDRFMNWSQLKELAHNGMSIQSHTLSHRPLENLALSEVYKELFQSKSRIENELNTNVNAISFPHGSYNKDIVKIARDVGYSVMCTSDVRFNYYVPSQGAPVLLGRIAITRKSGMERFVRLVDYQRREILSELIIKGSKNLLKRAIGIENYRKLYRRYFNIIAQG